MALLAEHAAQMLAAYPNVEVRCGDGTFGWPEQAPFDAIIVSAAGPRLPPTLMEQLAPGGRLVMPLGTERDQKLVRVTRTGQGEFAREDLIHVRFVPLGRRSRRRIFLLKMTASTRRW